jgi:hypothetical protein
MPYSLKYEHPHFPAGTVFNVGGLDRVENGSTLEIDDDMERNFIAARGMTVEDGFKNDPSVELSGSSALDADEMKAMLEAYAPVPPLVEEAPVEQDNVDEEDAPTRSRFRGVSEDG